MRSFWVHQLFSSSFFSSQLLKFDAAGLCKQVFRKLTHFQFCFSHTLGTCFMPTVSVLSFTFAVNWTFHMLLSVATLLVVCPCLGAPIFKILNVNAYIIMLEGSPFSHKVCFTKRRWTIFQAAISSKSRVKETVLYSIVVENISRYGMNRRETFPFRKWSMPF